MTEDCYCDIGEPSTFLHETKVKAARKEHRCGECHRPVRVGEPYERVFGICDARPFTAVTCARCLEVRSFVTAHVPCFCWLYGDMLSAAMETVNAYWHEAPGLWFGWGRRVVAVRRNAR